MHLSCYAFLACQKRTLRLLKTVQNLHGNYCFSSYVAGADCTKGDAEREFTCWTGGSVTVSCHYDRKYIQHKKYWCYHANGIYNYCSVLAYANETKSVSTLTTDSSTTDSMHETSIPNHSGQTSSSKEQRNILQYGRLMMRHLLTVLLLMLMLLIAAATVILRKKHKRNNTHITHEERDKTSDADSVNPECDVIYSSVIKLHQTKACSPVCEEKNVIYSSVCKQQQAKVLYVASL
ncbi:putative polymeric immunoglobulin receptor-like [Triplophysa rosa]|nr:putative polymeric immunoglobulin receptor-like [Triplophysa rosa]